MNVLVICPESAAREHNAAGAPGLPFVRRGRDRKLWFWWPALGNEPLQGCRFDVLIITISLRREQRDWVLANCTDGDTLVVVGSFLL